MRRVIMAMALAGAVQTAHAADMPVLRGGFQDDVAPRTVRWEGFYVGGQGALGRSEMNFSNSTSDLAARLLNRTVLNNELQVSQWPVMGKDTKSGSGFGAFVGYNSQWDDVVLGIEANYVHGKFGVSDSGSMARSFSASDGYTYGVNYTSTASMNINDIGSVRVRAAYAWNWLLPYVFGGVSLGQADVTRSVEISGVAVNASAAPGFTTIPFDYTASDRKNSQFIYGYAAGLGADVMLAGGLFGRVEWEYLRFTGNIDATVNTVRAGLGYRF